MNAQLLEQFDKLVQVTNAKISNGEGDPIDGFRLKSYKKAFAIIAKHKTTINNGQELQHIKGIGPKIIDKINQVIHTGAIASIDNVAISEKNKVIQELTQVVMIGAGKAKELVDRYNVTSIDDLIHRHQLGEIELNKKIQLGLKYYAPQTGSNDTKLPENELHNNKLPDNKLHLDIPRDEMLIYEQEIIKRIHGCGLDSSGSTGSTGSTSPYTVEICGSFRRGNGTSNDVDVLITHPDFHIQQTEVLKPFTQANEKYYDIQRVKHGLKFILKQLAPLLVDTLSAGKYKYMGFFKLDHYPVRRIDIRFVPWECYPTGLLYFTGSMDLNKQMRQKAASKQMKLSEYGLFDQDHRMLPVSHEKDVFDLLSMEYLEPIDR